MRVLIGCECSGRVREAFRRLGHDAYSCDLGPAWDGSPYHLQADILTVLAYGWDLMITHPPCTYLCAAAEWAYGDGPYHQRVRPGTLVGLPRRQARERAIEFFLLVASAPISRIALENPKGCLSTRVRKSHQVIQPYQFGDDASKETHLWLKNLAPLVPTCYVAPRMVEGKRRWSNQTDSGQNRLSGRQSALRSVTYQGIADAMANQWGDIGNR